jgi:hypothetical protein
LKYLVIAALLALLLLLVYSRIYPYVQVLKKLFGIAKTVASPNEPGSVSTPRSERKLVRCESCGTWVPAERAIAIKSGGATYCSRECLEKTPSKPKMKIVG